MSDQIELSKDSAQFFEWRASQTHALIAIAEELRRMNDDRPKPPRVDVNQGDYQPHVYPFGRQV